MNGLPDFRIERDEEEEETEMMAVLVSLVDVVPFHSSTMIADFVFDIDGFFSSSFGVFMAESNLNLFPPFQFSSVHEDFSLTKGKV